MKLIKFKLGEKKKVKGTNSKFIDLLHFIEHKYKAINDELKFGYEIKRRRRSDA